VPLKLPAIEINFIYFAKGLIPMIHKRPLENY